MLYLCTYSDGGVLLSEEQEGDRNVPVALDERSAAAIRHLLRLESFELAHALGALAAWPVSSAPATADQPTHVAASSPGKDIPW